mmetsp:Transcript_8105/g.25370  ORF Transcript_8105/g.25370 Transcript_8105/m.25370 type:complete len:89 (-) Transcript_8105:1368-1634(-)
MTSTSAGLLSCAKFRPLTQKILSAYRYGRIFHVNGCNESTRSYLRKSKGTEPLDNTLPPVDRYESERCYYSACTNFTPRFLALSTGET